MKASSFTFDGVSLRLHRFLRKGTIDTAVLVLRAAIVIFILLLAILLINKLVSNFFATSSQITQLEQDVADSRQPLAVDPKDAANPPNYTLISQSKLMGELGAQASAQPTAAAKAVTQLNLQLIGTFISEGQAPYAIIEDSKKKVQDVFMLNDSIFNEAKLKKIGADRVEVEHDGKIEILKLDDAPDSAPTMKDGVATVGDNEYVVEEGELDKALENLPLLLTQARAVPYFKDGKSIGLRMFAIRSASIFEKIGLRNGDVLKSINGSSLGDLSQAMKLFERLKEERSLSLVLERNNEEKEFKYQIK